MIRLICGLESHCRRMMILSFYIPGSTMVSVISTLMFDVSYAVEVLVFMFAGGERFHTYVVFLIQ